MSTGSSEGGAFKQRSYSVREKLKCIEWYKENGSSIRKTALQFGIDRKRVREWINKEEVLRKSESQKYRLTEGMEVMSEEIESGVMEYLLEQRARGLTVTNGNLKDKALEIAKQLPQSGRIANFKASDGWLTRWKNRHGVGYWHGSNTLLPHVIRNKGAAPREDHSQDYVAVKQEKPDCDSGV